MDTFAGELQRNSLYRAARFANLEGILGFSVPSIILVKAWLMQITIYNKRARPAWLRIRDTQRLFSVKYLFGEANLG